MGNRPGVHRRDDDGGAPGENAKGGDDDAEDPLGDRSMDKELKKDEVSSALAARLRTWRRSTHSRRPPTQIELHNECSGTRYRWGHTVQG